MVTNAFAKGDINTLEYAVRKQMTAIHIIENINNSKNLVKRLKHSP